MPAGGGALIGSQVPWWIYAALGIVLVLVLMQYLPLFGGALLIVIVLGAWSTAAKAGRI